MSTRRDFDKRLVALEAEAERPVISTLLDLMMLEDAGIEVELSPELQRLVEMATQEGEEEPVSL